MFFDSFLLDLGFHFIGDLGKLFRVCLFVIPFWVIGLTLLGENFVDPSIQSIDIKILSQLIYILFFIYVLRVSLHSQRIDLNRVMRSKLINYDLLFHFNIIIHSLDLGN